MAYAIANDGTEGLQETRCETIEASSVPYGIHETQVLEDEEADLHKHLAGCKKNPGHKRFTPVNDFTIAHMPEDYQEEDLVELIRRTADLTVRVAVAKVSQHRPEFWPNSRQKYDFYDRRERDTSRRGTGMVLQVCKWTEKQFKGTCKCQKCVNSRTPSKVWGEIKVHTAAHVVHDDTEARHTTCRLFFDRDDSPLVTIDGCSVYHVNVEEDLCQMKCVTCDEDLIDKLSKMLENWWMQWGNVMCNYKKDDTFTFIVSHPHGCSKQVSVGHWTYKKLLGNNKTSYTYTTCTCPGSSGANVHSLGFHDPLYFSRHVHRGVDADGNNRSAAGEDYSKMFEELIFNKNSNSS